jgi:hypothetical protein
MSVAVFGDLFVATDLEEAVQDTLKLWFPTYLAEVERQKGLEPHFIPVPPEAGYGRVNEFTKFQEDRLPAVIVVSPGIAPRPPLMAGTGAWRAWYRVGVAVVASGNDRDSTRNLSKWYTAALKGAILQHEDLGEFGAAGIAWTNERNTDVPDEQGRTLGSAAVTFDVEVHDVVNSRLGLLTPPEDPYEDFEPQEITARHLDVEIKE